MPFSALFSLSNVVMCFFLGPELSLADGVSMLQLQSSGTRCMRSAPLVVDNQRWALKAHLFLQAYT